MLENRNSSANLYAELNKSSYSETSNCTDDMYENTFRKLRIAFVSDFFVPNLGGVEMHMYNVA